MNFSRYGADLFLAKCNSSKILSFINKGLSILKKIIDSLLVALFFIVGNIFFNLILPSLSNLTMLSNLPMFSNLQTLTKANVFAESQIFSMLSQEAVLYVLLSHIIVKFTLKLCFLFVAVKVVLVLAKFFVCAIIKNERKVNNENVAVINNNGVVCYKSKVQFLN